jgi:glucosamine 6-phosphate synthetase-like amidotransferase/phosphosugar isomerase protein
MCGIFGFIAKTAHGPDLQQLRQIALDTERRGPHAFGWAWIDDRGRLQSFKSEGRISDSLGLLPMLRNARLVIGHTRYATQGTPTDNINNHPHPVDGGWLVHNGMIRNYVDLIDEHRLHPSSDCDSEVLGLLAERGRGTTLERTVSAVREVGRTPLAMLGLWSRPERMVVIRSGNPLSRGENERGIYLASLTSSLPASLHRSEVPDNSGTLIRTVEGEITERGCSIFPRLYRAAGLL